MKKVFFDVDTRLSHYKEIMNSITCIKVNNLGDADVIVVLKKTKELNHCIELIRKRTLFTPILTTLTTNVIGNYVYFFNLKLVDIHFNNLRNYLSDILNDITHIDIQLAYKHLNTRTEILDMITYVDSLIDIGKLTLRHSYNDNCAHITGYNRRENITVSCFVSNNSNFFNENLTIYTRSNGIFKLNGDGLGEHTYIERYGVAIDSIVENVCSNKTFIKQNRTKNTILKFNGSSRGSDTSAVRTGGRFR